MLIDSLAYIFETLILINTNMYNGNVPKVTLNFDSCVAPAISIREYLQRILTLSLCHESCLVMSLIFIDRLIASNKIIVSNLNIHRIVLTGIVLAIKSCEDTYYTNSFYAKLGGISVKELSILELDLLKMIDFRLYVHPDQFFEYFNKIKGHLVTRSCGVGVSVACALTQPAASDRLFNAIEGGDSGNCGSVHDGCSNGGNDVHDGRCNSLMFATSDKTSSYFSPFEYDQHLPHYHVSAPLPPQPPPPPPFFCFPAMPDVAYNPNVPSQQSASLTSTYSYQDHRQFQQQLLQQQQQQQLQHFQQLQYHHYYGGRDSNNNRYSESKSEVSPMIVSTRFSDVDDRSRYHGIIGVDISTGCGGNMAFAASMGATTPVHVSSNSNSNYASVLMPTSMEPNDLSHQIHVSQCPSIVKSIYYYNGNPSPSSITFDGSSGSFDGHSSVVDASGLASCCGGGGGSGRDGVVVGGVGGGGYSGGCGDRAGFDSGLTAGSADYRNF